MEFVLIAIAISILLYLSRAICIIPARKMALVERFGLYQRTLMPGMYVLLYPFEYLRYTRWTYRNQENKMSIVSTCHVSNDLQQMDIPPVKCVSLETNPITVDVVVMYKITDLAKAVYETGDVLNLFYQAIHQAVRDACSQYSIDRLQGRDKTLTLDMMNLATQYLGPDDRGIRCVSILVQDIVFGSSILEARQKRFDADQERKRRMDEVVYLEEMQKREQSMALSKAESAAAQEATRHVAGINPYLKNGFTVDQIIAMKQTEALAKAKKVYVFTGNGQQQQQQQQFVLKN